MNIAISDGVVLTPQPYADGLNVWSRGDGTPGSPTYDNSTQGVFVPADQDFGGAIEIAKTDSTQRLRHMGQTPIIPGCYLRITARVKAVSGNLPSVRIAGYPARSNNTQVPGVVITGPSTPLTTYGEVVEVSAIVGIGNRDGVDMVWGPTAVYGHFGIDLIGQNGGVVRVDDIEIDDISSAFLGDVVATVDVRDYGAIGDGSTDDSAAFDAANSAADGRTVLIPDGVFRLNNSVTFDSPTKFEGRVTMPDAAMLLLRANYDIDHYIEAFENEELAFKKAFQALLNNSDHEGLDLCGRKILLTEPVDMQAAVVNRTSYATRRVIHSGQILVDTNGDWGTITQTGQGTYDPNNSKTLSNVSNLANIPVGARVSGAGVGREVYVKSKNLATGELTLSASLHDAAGTQNYTFRRYKYLLDFSGFSALSKLVLRDIEFQCSNEASGILLAPSGKIFTLQNCFITTPGNRGLTSHGTGCQGMIIENCQFLSGEDDLSVPQRSTIALNANANDIKLRNNRATRFRHFAVVAGGNSIISGNHFFQGDNVAGGARSAGLIIAKQHASTVISENYVDNCFIEWTNEHDQNPGFSSEFSFSAIEITSNIFLSGDVVSSFSYIVVRPHGPGHFLNGVNISGNRFRSINGSIYRAERVDTSFADLDYSRFKNVIFTGNSFHNVTRSVANPKEMRYSRTSPAQTWAIGLGDTLPFGGHARNITSVVPINPIRNSNNVIQYAAPYAKTSEGVNDDQIHLVWQQAVKGEVQVTVRMDNNL